jgi:hypothetical protein
MSHLLIQPLVGVGPVRLGASRDEVIAALGEPERQFKKVATSQHTTHTWFDGQLQVFYSGAEPTVEYIELIAGSAFTPQLLGLTVFSTPAMQLVSKLQEVGALDEADPELGYSYVFPSLELSMWRPEVSEPDGHFFSTVGVGIHGYYSNRVA